MPSKPFSLAVSAIILDDQARCLLVRRSSMSNHFAGQWEWPGGKLEKDEGFETALQREVREETGLEVELTGLGGAAEMELEDVRVVRVCMEARILGGTVKLSQEHDDFVWTPLDRMTDRELNHGARAFMIDYAVRHTSAYDRSPAAD